MKKASISTNIFSDHKNKKKYGIIACIFLAAVIVVLLVNSEGNFRPGSATLILAFENNGKGRIFTGDVVRNMTILDALIASSEAGNIELKYNIDARNRTKIISLNSYTSELAKKHIVFYVNNKKIDEGSINNVLIGAGDTVKVNLEN